MAWVRRAMVRIGAPDEDGDRRLQAFVEVDNRGEAYDASQLGVVFRDAGGALLYTETLEGGPVPRGRHLLEFSGWPDPTLRPESAEGTLLLRRSLGLEPVRLAGGEPEAAAQPPVGNGEGGDAEPAAEAGPAEGAVPPPPEPALRREDPWALLDAGERDRALAALAGRDLDSLGRDRVRELARSGEAADLVLACDIARLTGWRSFATNLRRLVGHAEPSVRAAAARALGVLGGPALVITLRRLLADEDEAVRAAAEEAIERLGG